MKKKNAFVSKKATERNEKIFVTIIIALASISILMPMVNMTMGAFSSKEVIRKRPSSLVPIEAKRVNIPELSKRDRYTVYMLPLEGKPVELAYINKSDRRQIFADPQSPMDIRFLPFPAADSAVMIDVPDPDAPTVDEKGKALEPVMIQKQKTVTIAVTSIGKGLDLQKILAVNPDFNPEVNYAVYKVKVDGVEKEMALLDNYPLLWPYVKESEPDKVYFFPPAEHTQRVEVVVFNWQNIPEAFEKLPVVKQISNTVFIMVIATIGTVISSTMVAYGFSRFYFRASAALFMILLATMMLPPQVSLIPSFVGFRLIGWFDTYLPLLVPAFFASSAWNIFLMRQFFMGLPLELDDAAKIDGCGPIRTLFHVILPQSAPILITITLFSCVWWWNEYFYTVIYLQNADLWPVAIGLASFDAAYFNHNHLKSAATLILMLPPIITFFLFQKQFIQGTVVSGVKG